jgi:hypothetical protein
MFLNRSHNVDEETEYARSLYCSGGRDSEGISVDVVTNRPAPMGVYVLSCKDVKLWHAVDVFGQCSCQRLEVSVAHSALKARRIGVLTCGCHGDEELGWYKLSLARFLPSCCFVRVHRQFLATVQNLDVGGLERLAGASLVSFCSSGAEPQVTFH